MTFRERLGVLTMTEISIDRHQWVAAQCAQLEKVFIKTATYDRFKNQFQEHLYQRRAEVEADVETESAGIVLAGAPGSGKTRLLRNMLRTLPDLRRDTSSRQLDLILVRVPATTTVLEIGQRILQELGYGSRKSGKSDEVWDVVAKQLRMRGVKFVCLDESQDLIFNQNGREIRLALSAMKSLMNNLTWPVNVVLTGTPELVELVNLDEQLVRRVVPIEIPKVSFATEGGGMSMVLEHFTSIVALGIDAKLRTPDFSMRLFHAASYEHGLVFEFVKKAIRVCLYRGDQHLCLEHFASYFETRTGAPDGLNPFLAPCFDDLEVRRLLPARSPDTHGTTIQRAVHRWKKVGK